MRTRIYIIGVIAILLSAGCNGNSHICQADTQLGFPCNAIRDDLDIHQALVEFAEEMNLSNNLVEDNEILTRLAEQWALIRLFVDNLESMRTTTRGLVMDPNTFTISSPSMNAKGLMAVCDSLITDIKFVIGVLPDVLEDEELTSALLTFAGMCANNVRFQVMEELTGTMFTTRCDLTPAQLTQLEALEAYMAKVNAPFWQNPDLYDPVIAYIGLPLIHESNPIFTVWLYDPTLIGLSDAEFSRRTAPLLADIVEFIGSSEHFVLRVIE